MSLNEEKAEKLASCSLHLVAWNFDLSRLLLRSCPEKLDADD